MDKRREANLRVKAQIIKALFSLMERKNLAEITITELVSTAGVARASFYRNYNSKEDVLVTLIRDVLEKYRGEIDLEDGFYSSGNVLLSFQYFQIYRSYVLNLYRSGFASVLLEELSRFHESVAGTMPAASIERYQLYLYVGALFNTAIVWLSQDCGTDCEEIARFFLSRIRT